MEVVLLLNSLNVHITISGYLGNTIAVFVPRSLNKQNSYHPVYMSDVNVFYFAIFTVIWPILG
jgi:hypothetical protein